MVRLGGMAETAPPGQSRDLETERIFALADGILGVKNQKPEHFQQGNDRRRPSLAERGGASRLAGAAAGRLPLRSARPGVLRDLFWRPGRE